MHFLVEPTDSQSLNCFDFLLDVEDISKAPSQERLVRVVFKHRTNATLSTLEDVL